MPLIEQVLAVIFVLGLLAGALWAAGRRSRLPLRMPGSRGTETAAVQVVQRLPLTPQHCLHVVKSEGSILLVGTHPAGIVFAPQGATFAESLSQALRGGPEVGR